MQQTTPAARPYLKHHKFVVVIHKPIAQLLIEFALGFLVVVPIHVRSVGFLNLAANGVLHEARYDRGENDIERDIGEAAGHS